jgi:signal transduction histidine kinase
MLENIWNFVKPVANNDISKHPEIIGKMDEMIPLNISLGIGLPMAKVYAKYWGGTMSLYSMHGYGSDVYVTLNIANSFENFYDE